MGRQRKTDERDNPEPPNSLPLTPLVFHIRDGVARLGVSATHERPVAVVYDVSRLNGACPQRSAVLRLCYMRTTQGDHTWRVPLEQILLRLRPCFRIDLQVCCRTAAGVAVDRRRRSLRASAAEDEM